MNETIDQTGNLVYTNLYATNMVDVTNRLRSLIVIAAVDADGGYAKQGEIPWYYSEDFKWFKHRTDNTICVMGRKTYEDINKRLGDKAKESVLPGRTCYVVSSKLENVTNATVIKSLSDLNTLIDVDDKRDISVIGGGQLFKEAIAKADVVFVTIINDQHECDAFFPVQYLMKHFKPTQTYKGKEPKLRYTVWARQHVTPKPRSF